MVKSRGHPRLFLLNIFSQKRKGSLHEIKLFVLIPAEAITIIFFIFFTYFLVIIIVFRTRNIQVFSAVINPFIQCFIVIIGIIKFCP